MVGTSDIDREGTGLPGLGAAVASTELNDWFVREVLPLEAALVNFLRRSWRNQSEVADLCQDVYVRAYETAQSERPKSVKPFVFAIARNLITDRIRREQIVPIETVADLDLLNVEIDQPGPERAVIAREELRNLQLALDRMPQRCREAVVLKKVDGFAGITLRRSIAKISLGYRADLFFGAMDGGIDAAKKENVGFYGPFAMISVGIGG